MSAPCLTAKVTSPHETPPTSNLAAPQLQSSNESLIGKNINDFGLCMYTTNAQSTIYFLHFSFLFIYLFIYLFSFFKLIARKLVLSF